MFSLTTKEWDEREARIRELVAQRLAAGWTKDQWGRWIPPHDTED